MNAFLRVTTAILPIAPHLAGTFAAEALRPVTLAADTKPAPQDLRRVA